MIPAPAICDEVANPLASFCGGPRDSSHLLPQVNIMRAIGYRMLVICATCALATGCALPKPETLVSPTPIQGDSGKFLNPYHADGTLAPWANKGIHTSRAAGGVAGFAASEAIAMFVPIGEVSMAAEDLV